MSEMIGKILDQRYELKEFIGKGGMAIVYRAIDLRTGHSVAVKILRPEYNRDEEFLNRFQREATTASKMSHHNIVNLLDVGQDGEYRYLVMEYVMGKTLKDVIDEKGALPPQIAAQIAIRILSALQHAHKNGIIHRDIKPQNILVHSEGHIKVADFGIARVAGSNTLTKSDSVMGSVYYFSPEQAKGENVTAASDLYSVGVVLYEMLTGSVPFDGDSPVAVALQQINASPRAPREIKPDIPPAMESVVLKAMEKDPKRRYQSALEMAQDLHRAMHEPEGDWLGQIQDQPIPMISQVVSPPPKRRAMPQILWTKVLAAFLCLLVAIGLVEGTIYLYNMIINTTSAPYLLDETEESALKLVAKAGLKAEISRTSDNVKPAGTVILQSPDYETRMKKGETILITVSTGPEEQPVPNVCGKDVESAREELEKFGFSLLALPKREVSDQPWNTVLKQDPLDGTNLTVGSIVQVTLSGGSVTLPDLVGQMRDSAMLRLQELGLKVTEIKEIVVNDVARNGIVAAQQYMDSDYVQYAPGAQVMQDIQVTLGIYVYDENVTAAPEGSEQEGSSAP